MIRAGRILQLVAHPGYRGNADGEPSRNVGQLSVGASPVQILQLNYQRTGVIVTNTGGTAVYLSASPQVTTSSGHALPGGDSITLENGAPLWAVGGATAVTVTYLEELIR